MLIENQFVDVIWGPRNKKHYIKKGYAFTKFGDSISVSVKDLIAKSSVEVDLTCDFCFRKIKKKYFNFINQRKMSSKDSCHECTGLKISFTKNENRKKVTSKQCILCKKTKPLDSNSFKVTSSGFTKKCLQCINKTNVQKIRKDEQSIPFAESREIYTNAIVNNISLPRFFWEKCDSKKMLDYIMDNKTKMRKAAFSSISINFIAKYRLHYFIKKYGSMYDFIETYYPGEYLPWLSENKVGNKFWSSDCNKRRAIQWLIDQLKKENEIKSINDIPKKVNFSTFKKYGLGGLVARHFGSSVYRTMNFVYPGLFKPWQFKVPGQHYEKKENRLEILQWFVEKLIYDKLITDISEIPSKVNIATFEKYELKTFLMHVYSGVTYRAFDDLYPGMWKVWEFKSCPTGYWDNEKNIKLAIDWLLRKLVSDNHIAEICFSGEIDIKRYMKNYGLGTLLKPSFNIERFLIGNYPRIFNEENLLLNISSDGLKMLSKEEMTLHNYLLQGSIDVIYCGLDRNYQFIDPKTNKTYIPDWIINDNVIVEYFGYFNKSSNHIRFTKYRHKTQDKISFFNSLIAYKFIPLYKEDIQNGFKGVKRKFNEVGIKL
ncbi:hypothetical protein [Bacillus pumilus]|uniref:hypothetical protein n=1 Tax=Bacillus pumilus TaxID=1408 RepID=UPI0011A752B8|nr:hypothetical protein [Bacillus pumilus]